jgi:ATP-dependent DNA helicase RecQ
MGLACALTTDSANSLETALHGHFGFEQFRTGQREVLESVLAGRDTVVVMPTGSGKSLCYQLPALMKAGVTIVVSPLIALMKDQVETLEARNLPATFINSTLTPEEQRERIRAAAQGAFKLLYVAPERFRSDYLTDALRGAHIALFAVDEAHCISQWGHDFRPDYLRLREAIEALGRPQIVALTATATPYVRADIAQQLSLHNPAVFISGFDRPNLFLEVVQVQKERQKIARIRQLARHYEGCSGIVYAATRKAVEQVAAQLQTAGVSAAAYHAGLPDAARHRAQDAFMDGSRQVIVATNAFGMGIDKPDIRFVAHFQMPGSLEAYYQEIGRAGRDGLPASCVMLFNYADKRTHDFFIDNSFSADPNRAALERRKLREMISFCYHEGCLRAYLLDYFGDAHGAACEGCSNCVEPPRRAPEPAAATDEPAAPRPLAADETTLIRKILACAARMEGRFGKNMLAAVLRGAREKKLLQANLDQLSTYGILAGLTQDELLLYIDALHTAGCLRTTGGAYPTVLLTPFGGQVMREQARVELALTADAFDAPPEQPEKPPRTPTIDETYRLYEQGLTLAEIAAARGLTAQTIENHLADCIKQGREFDLSRFVTEADRRLIERAAVEHGTQFLKPIRDALPAHISYAMIRLVLADAETHKGVGNASS